MSEQGPLALILAGGASRRMGCDKASLRIRGRTWFAQAQAVSQEALGTDAPIYCSVSAETVESQASRFVPDDPEFKGLGPLAGIASFCRFLTRKGEALGGRILLVVPVDMPLLEAGDLRKLVEAFEPDAKLGAVHFEGTVLPCAVRLFGDESAILERRLRATEGRRSVTDWLHSHAARALPAHTRLKNVNTPEEWARISEGDVQ